MWADISGHLSGFRIEPQEFIDCGETVIVVVEAQGTGSGSGAAVNQRWVQLATISEGLVRRIEPFTTREEALGAAASSD